MNIKKLTEAINLIVNEDDNRSILKKELEHLYYGIGWSEWEYFKEGLDYASKFDLTAVSDTELEQMINDSGIAKVKKVKDIKNYSDMEDFDPSYFDASDKIIVTKKPMSSKFFGESVQKKFALSLDGEPQGEFTEKELVDMAREIMRDADETDKLARCHDIEDVKNLMKGLSWQIKELNGEIITTGDKVAQKNEAAVKGNTVDFDKIGGAFNVYVDSNVYVDAKTYPRKIIPKVRVRIGCVSKGAQVIASKELLGMEVDDVFKAAAIDEAKVIGIVTDLTNKFERDLEAALKKMGYNK